MGFLDRLDERVVGPKGQPPDPRRLKAGHWFGVALVLAIVIAGFVASGSHNPAVWPLAGMATGSLLFGGRRARQRPPSPPATPEGTQQTSDRVSVDTDIHNFASSIVESKERNE